MALRAAVVASGLPRAGTIGGAPLSVDKFVGSVELLAGAYTLPLFGLT